jgi:hypothetical protein
VIKAKIRSCSSARAISLWLIRFRSLGDVPGLRVQTQELPPIRWTRSQDLADRRRDDVLASDRPAERHQRCGRQGN